MDFNLKEIKALIKIFDESKSDYFSFSNADFKVKLRKNPPIAVSSSVRDAAWMPIFASAASACGYQTVEGGTSPVLSSGSSHISSSLSSPAPGSSLARDSSSDRLGDRAFEVKSPIVGVFYAAKEPGAKPFVKEGDMVEKGQVLCILESMKMLNEVKSPRSGKVVKACVSNESLVEYGQVLFVLEE